VNVVGTSLEKMNQLDVVVAHVLLKNQGRELTLQEIANRTGTTPKETLRALWKLFVLEPLL
jgi:hypothetical protein